MKVSNSLGTYYEVGATAYNTGSSVVGVKVYAEEFNLLEWICVTVIAFKKFSITNEAYMRASSPISNAIGISSLPIYQTLTLVSNVQFFGISSLKLSLLLDQDHKFRLSTSNPLNPTTLTTNANLLHVTLEQFFVWSVACGTMIDTSTMTCVSPCPTNYYANALQFCVQCGGGSNCLTCDSSGCLTCDTTAPTFRQLSGTLCPCNPSYY
jgi:hypothetical protein